MTHRRFLLTVVGLSRRGKPGMALPCLGRGEPRARDGRPWGGKTEDMAFLGSRLALFWGVSKPRQGLDLTKSRLSGRPAEESGPACAGAGPPPGPPPLALLLDPTCCSCEETEEARGHQWVSQQVGPGRVWALSCPELQVSPGMTLPPRFSRLSGSLGHA